MPTSCCWQLAKNLFFENIKKYFLALKQRTNMALLMRTVSSNHLHFWNLMNITVGQCVFKYLRYLIFLIWKGLIYWKSEQKIIRIYLHYVISNPSKWVGFDTRSISKKFNRFELGFTSLRLVVILRLKRKSTLFTDSLGENWWIHNFAKSISAMWNANSLVSIWTLVIVSISYDNLMSTPKFEIFGTKQYELFNFFLCTITTIDDCREFLL